LGNYCMCTEETNKVAKIKKPIYYALLLLYCTNAKKFLKIKATGSQ
jgi:hypothetical protein